MADKATKHCPLESTCELYPLFRLAGMQGLWQSLYCHATFERCQRLRLERLGRPVPKHLLPDGQLLRLKPRSSPGRPSRKP